MHRIICKCFSKLLKFVKLKKHIKNFLELMSVFFRACEVLKGSKEAAAVAAVVIKNATLQANSLTVCRVVYVACWLFLLFSWCILMQYGAKHACSHTHT